MVIRHSKPQFFNFLLFLLIINFSGNGCKRAKSFKIISSSDSALIQIDTLRSQLFRHISMIKLSNGNEFSCNGLLYQSGDSVVIFDTPASTQATDALLNWIDKHHLKIKGVVLNHFHEDCTAGLSQMIDRKVNLYAHRKTAAFLQSGNPILVFDSIQTLTVNNDSVINMYPGWAHSADNIVSYIPEYEALFGGCMIKASGAGKGNLKDANISTWPYSAERVKAAFPNLLLVVPGHGSPGGMELLDYTISLFSVD